MVNRILEGLFPAYCTLCGLTSHSTHPLCAACEDSLVGNRHCCGICAVPMPTMTDFGPARSCAQCSVRAPSYERVLAPWLYDEHMALLIHAWKFRAQRQLTPLFARLWLQEWNQPLSVDAIVPVPLHWLRLCQRGFNQSFLLCQQLRRLSPQLRAVNLRTNLVSRARPTQAQSKMNAVDRSRNLTAAFRINKPCEGLRIAIVDDVMTTGSTVSALAHCLRAAGAESVEVWCIARTPAPPN